MGNYTLWSAALNRKIPRSTMAGWIRDGVIPPADTRVGRSPYWFETTVHQTLTSREKKVAA
jgi:predicted site-specific integrase-resolvase